MEGLYDIPLCKVCGVRCFVGVVEKDSPNKGKRYCKCAAGCDFYRFMEDPFLRTDEEPAQKKQRCTQHIVTPPPSNTATIINAPTAPQPTTVTPVTADPAVLCKCKLVADKFPSKNERTFGKIFFRCANWRDRDLRCDFFESETNVYRASVDAHKPQSRAVIRHDQHYDTSRRALRDEEQPKNKKAHMLDLYCSFAERKGYRVIRSTTYEQVYMYRDARLLRGAQNHEEHFVYLEPADPQLLNDGLYWIQLRSSRSEDNGWVIGERAQANIILVDGVDCFYMLDRKLLWAYLDRHVRDRIVTDKKDALLNRYSPYTNGRMELTLVDMEELKRERVVVDTWPLDEVQSQRLRTIQQQDVEPAPVMVTTTSTGEQQVYPENVEL